VLACVLSINSINENEWMNECVKTELGTCWSRVRALTTKLIEPQMLKHACRIEVLDHMYITRPHSVIRIDVFGWYNNYRFKHTVSQKSTPQTLFDLETYGLILINFNVVRSSADKHNFKSARKFNFQCNFTSAIGLGLPLNSSFRDDATRIVFWPLIALQCKLSGISCCCC